LCAPYKGKDQFFEWEPRAVDKDNGPPDALEPDAEIHDTLSILSDLSEDEDVTSSDATTQNAFSGDRNEADE